MQENIEACTAPPMGAMQAFLMQFLFCQVFCEQFRNVIHSNENTHKDNQQNACVKPVDFKPAVDGRGEYFVEKFQRRTLVIEQIKIIWLTVLRHDRSKPFGICRRLPIG